MVCICQDNIKGEDDQFKSFLLCCKTKRCFFLFNSVPSFFLFWLSASFQQMVFLKGKCYLRGRLYTVGRYLSFYFFQLCLKKKAATISVYAHRKYFRVAVQNCSNRI